MRVRFRISVLKGGKRLTKKDLEGERDPLLVGIRYVTEFKYLEATKWLMLSEDCWEKFLLLGLLNVALGQEEQGREFLSMAEGKRRRTDLSFFVEKPEEGKRKEVRSVTDLCGIL